MFIWALLIKGEPSDFLTMKKFKRYLHLFGKLRFKLMRNGYKRADYLRKKELLASIGGNVYFYSRIMPEDPGLIRLGSNVVIATNVRFVNHDRADIMLSGMTGEKYSKYYGCIEVGDNVFIGSDVIILPGVRIGSNTVIGAGAVVTKDLPSGFTWGGSPAKCIGEFKNFADGREKKQTKNQEKLWQAFYACRDNNL